MRAMRGLAFAGIIAGCGGGGGDDGTTSDAAIPPPPGETCDLPIAADDVSSPTAVVGDGSAGSCTEAALATALAGGGVITFACGADPVTIAITTQLEVTGDTVLDGGDLVTLDGGGATRILHLASAWDQSTPLLTVQHLGFQNGHATEGGGAIFQDGGTLHVLSCTFAHNQAAAVGQDVAGGAINGLGVGDLVIEDSVIADNSASNGGGVGTQAENVTVVNTVFSHDDATGNGGNPGNGGDGGALSYDGADNALTLCGDRFEGNHANAQGGAIFRVAYGSEPTTIDRSAFVGNSVDPTSGLAGGLYLEHTVIEMTATEISGNSAFYGGGFWIGNAAVAHLTNVTIANNTATMGGGVWFAGGVTGRFQSCTIAGNDADGLFGGDTGVELADTLVTGNQHYSCTDGHADGGPVLEFPAPWGSGQPCTPTAAVLDPLLGPLVDNGGPTMTMMPGAGSPALGAGTSCPPYDQRGHARAAACTLGAVEVE